MLLLFTCYLLFKKEERFLFSLFFLLLLASTLHPHIKRHSSGIEVSLSLSSSLLLCSGDSSVRCFYFSLVVVRKEFFFVCITSKVGFGNVAEGLLRLW